MLEGGTKFLGRPPFTMCLEQVRLEPNRCDLGKYAEPNEHFTRIRIVSDMTLTQKQFTTVRGVRKVRRPRKAARRAELLKALKGLRDAKIVSTGLMRFEVSR